MMQINDISIQEIHKKIRRQQNNYSEIYDKIDITPVGGAFTVRFDDAKDARSCACSLLNYKRNHREEMMGVIISHKMNYVYIYKT